MNSSTVKSAISGSLLLIAAVVPALLTALPGRIELRRAREEAGATPLPDAGALFADEEARRRLEHDVVPYAQEAAAYVSPAAPADDAAGDRVLRLMEAAAETGAIYLSSSPAEKSDHREGGYSFHVVDLKAEGSFAAIHAYLSALERGERLIVVQKATLRRDPSSDHPKVLLEARLAFAERVEAPDPKAVLNTAGDPPEGGR